MTTTDESDYTAYLEEKSLAQDIVSDTSASFIAQDPRNAVDMMSLKNLFFSEDWVFIVCDRIASKISSQWLRVMKEEVVDGKKTVSPAEGHAVQKIFETPNEDQDYHSWMYALVVDECLMGNAMVWRAEKTGQLVLLPSESTHIDVGQDGSIKSYRVYYQQDLTKRVLKFDPEEVCHIRRPNPTSRLHGLSPFIPGRKAVNFNKYTTEYLNNFYLKGAMPGLILEMTDVANEKQAIRLLRSFENAYTGRANQRKTLITPKGVTVQTLNQSLADQQLIEYVRANRETIMNLLQIPKHELGLAESGSLGSEEYKTALKNFWSGQLRSIMRRISGSLTKFFAKELGEGYFLEFDLADVDVLQEDQEQKAALAERLLATHTVNEIRGKLYDLDPVENGDTVRGTAPQMPSFAPPPQAQLSLDQALGVVHDVEKGIIKRESAAAMLASLFGMSEEVIAQMLGSAQTSNNSEVKATNLENFTLLSKSVGSWFEETDNEIANTTQSTMPLMMKRLFSLFAGQVDAGVRVLLGTDKATKELPPPKTLRKRIRQALGDLEDQYMNGLFPELESSINVGYDSTVAVSFNQEDADKLAAIKAKNEAKRRVLLEDRGLTSFAYMSDTTTEQMMQIIENGVKEKLTVEQIARSIATDDRFSNIENLTKRAMVIARTEIMTAASVGQAQAMKDSEKVLGPLLKMWVNAGDERVRGPGGIYPNSDYDHRRLQGEVVPSNKKFSNGLMYPRDPSGDPGDVIQCRCRVVAVSKEDAEAMGFGKLDREATAGGGL
jgi:HK97 family phage portal protein